MPDVVDYPPLERRFRSASGGFLLTVKALDGWKTQKAGATLRNAGGAVLWQRELPHHHGPRRALVTNGGQVLLVDEWINVISRFALILIAPDGSTIAEYSAEQIITLLAVPRREITAHARYGPRLSVVPGISADANAVLFEAGGRRLSLRLDTGRLSAGD